MGKPKGCLMTYWHGGPRIEGEMVLPSHESGVGVTSEARIRRTRANAGKPRRAAANA
jgi:hypothetical protein